MERTPRPWGAGAVLGLLACKPHFAVLLPLLVAAGGRWRILGGMAGSAAILTTASLVAFGPAPWVAFLRGLPDMAQVLASGGLSWAKVPTVFAGALSLGCAASRGDGAARRRRRDRPRERRRSSGGAAERLRLKGAVAVSATLLISPYLFDYDLVLASVAAALVIASGTRGHRAEAWRAGGAGRRRLWPRPCSSSPVCRPGALGLIALHAATLTAYWSEARLSAGSATGSGGPARFTTRWVG